MITLKRNEDIEIFQVELALKLKTKQSPFISILILADELDKEEFYIDSETLQEKLLPSLPIKACENLLERLTHQSYFEEIWDDGDKFLGYELTEQGKESATDKSFWIGEKGVYNVFVAKSNLVQQDILFIEKGRIDIADERKQMDGNINIKEMRTPNFLKSEYSLFVKDTFYDEQKKQLVTAIERKDVYLESIDQKCFQLKSANGILEIQAKENETVLKLSKENQLLFQTNITIEENVLQGELLVACGEFEYNEDKKAIRTEFSKENLSLNRKVKIGKPIFQRNQFNQVELENISHIPSDKENADLWYWELLYKNMNEYFLEENSFKEFASELATPIQEHFKIKIPNRKELAEILTEREDAFYQIAKLETIDYLNY